MMSIFSNIKYPISHPPTEEELQAIPRRAYNTWANYVFQPHRNPSEYTMYLLMSTLLDNDPKQYKTNHDLLKDLIFQIDEPDDNTR